MQLIDGEIQTQADAGEQDAQRRGPLEVAARNGIEHFKRQRVRPLRDVASEHERNAHFAERARYAEQQPHDKAGADQRNDHEKKGGYRTGTGHARRFRELAYRFTAERRLDGFDDQRQPAM